MKGFDPGKGTGLNIRKINKAKRLTRKHVGHTTVDSPTYGTKKSDRKFPRSEKKMNKAVDLLRNQGYSEEEIEQFTGATGYKDAMDWATEPMQNISKQIPKQKKTPNPPPFKRKDDTKLPSDSTLTINTADSGRLEGEILGIYDNEYHEAKMDNDSTKIKNLENLMLKMKNKVIERGDGELFTKDKSHIDMSKFNSPLKKNGNGNGKRGYDTGGFEANEEKTQNKRRLKEVKSSIRDLKIERIKKIGNKRAQDNLKSAIAGLKQKKKELKNK